MKGRREPAKRSMPSRPMPAACRRRGGILIRGAAGIGQVDARPRGDRPRQRHGVASDASSATTAPASKERHGRLLARAGRSARRLIEIRGLGIVRQSFEAAAIVRLVIDLCDDPERYPEAATEHIVLCGVMLPRLRPQAGAISLDIALGSLSGVYDTVVTL